MHFLRDGTRHGPYKTITETVDGLLCDGMLWSYTTIGDDCEIIEDDSLLPPPPAPLRWVPDQVTMRQGQLALLYADLLDDVDEAFEAMLAAATAALEATTIGTPEYALAFAAKQQARAALIEWKTSTIIMRYKDLTIFMGGNLGMSDEQLDDLFIFAHSIPLL